MDRIEILFENENVVALNKPAGIAVHPDGKNEFFTVVDFLLEKYPKIAEVGEPMILSNGERILRPGIVHRIDKDTSGVLLVARTPEGYAYLKEQFQNREVKKTYFAFVYGKMSEERGTIDLPIGRGALGKRVAGSGAKGELREAHTKFRTLKSESEVSCLEVWPLTGRTHQIRVHLKAIHHSIVCDPLYAPHREALLGFQRLALHAGRISFEDLDGSKREIKAPFPADFEEAFKKMGVKSSELLK